MVESRGKRLDEELACKSELLQSACRASSAGQQGTFDRSEIVVQICHGGRGAAEQAPCFDR